jgi:ABC-type polysaccharide/polyol phosphate export permease
MDITHEGPASFRTSAARKGPIALLREGAQEIYSRHHLIRYLARADMKKKGADTFFGNVWWVFDPLLQMVVYVVLVTLIFRRRPRLPVVHIRGDPAMEVVHDIGY